MLASHPHMLLPTSCLRSPSSSGLIIQSRRDRKKPTVYVSSGASLKYSGFLGSRSFSLSTPQATHTLQLRAFFLIATFTLSLPGTKSFLQYHLYLTTYKKQAANKRRHCSRPTERSKGVKGKTPAPNSLSFSAGIMITPVTTSEHPLWALLMWFARQSMWERLYCYVSIEEETEA